MKQAWEAHPAEAGMHVAGATVRLREMILEWHDNRTNGVIHMVKIEKTNKANKMSKLQKKAAKLISGVKVRSGLKAGCLRCGLITSAS
jgi:hypothetical protein